MSNDQIESFLVLRDELAKRAFDAKGVVVNSKLAEVVWKINSCLKGKYPF